MRKSNEPNSFTQVSTARCKALGSRTSTAPIPITREPVRAVSISFAIASVFSTLRPTIQAFAPRWTIARTWALHIVPFPPVQKTTLLSAKYLLGFDQLNYILLRNAPKMPSRQTSLRYSDRGRGIVQGTYFGGAAEVIGRVRVCGERNELLYETKLPFSTEDRTVLVTARFYKGREKVATHSLSNAFPLRTGSITEASRYIAVVRALKATVQSYCNLRTPSKILGQRK